MVEKKKKTGEITRKRKEATGFFGSWKSREAREKSYEPGAVHVRRRKKKA